MARKSGINGTIHSAATGGEVTEMTCEVMGWTITQSATVHKEGSNATGAWKGATAGGQEWSCTMNVFLDDTTSREFAIGSKYDVELHVDGDDSNYFSGTIVIEEISGPEADMDDGATLKYEITGQGDGALTETGTL